MVVVVPNLFIFVAATGYCLRFLGTSWNLTIFLGFCANTQNIVTLYLRYGTPSAFGHKPAIRTPATPFKLPSCTRVGLAILCCQKAAVHNRQQRVERVSSPVISIPGQ